MKKVNKDLVAFHRLAKSNGMTYGQLQQKETLLKMQRESFNNDKSRRTDDARKQD